MECNETEGGGGRGIRTPDDREAITDFKSAGFNHSPIPPKAEKNRLLTRRMQDYFEEITESFVWPQLALAANYYGQKTKIGESKKNLAIQ